MLKKPYKDVSEVFNFFPLLYGNCVAGQKERYETAFEKFKAYFGETESFIASSSGRVEMLGNHTDHNGGMVACCAISLDTLGFFLPTCDDIITIKSEGYPDVSIDLTDGKKGEKGTSEALVRGVGFALNERGYKTGGFKAYFTSNVAGGAGISSSASYEVLVAEIFNVLYNDGKIDAKTKAIVSRFAENEYFGKPCGLLDQSAIAYGGLKMLDFSVKGDIIVSDIDCKINDFTLVLVNTGGSHADLTDEYAAVPAEMFKVAAEFNEERLIDVGEDRFYAELHKLYNKLPDRAILRAVHFFAENKRVKDVAESLNKGDFEGFICGVNQSGLSSMNYLQNCYVANREERLIPKALAMASKFNPNGACRVHGGGFAGCVLCVVKNDHLDSFIEKMRSLYSDDSILKLSIRRVGAIVL